MAVDTTAAVQTTAPTVTCLAPTTEDIEERIANIIMRMPEMITVAKALPAIDEDGNRIPTFSMLVDDRFYMLMLQYERGELEYTFDFNDDGKLDICDDIEFEACKACNTYKNQFGRYPVNYNEMFPDKEVVERAEHWLTNNKPVYVITYSMLYHNVEIPDAETIEEIAREYVGGNCILIMLQKPDASLVAAFGKWKELGRTIIKGEKGIAILAPMTFKTKEVTERLVKDGDGKQVFNVDGSEKKETVENEVATIGFKKVYVFDVWLSDYVPNRLGGFIEEQPAQEQKKPDCPLIGQDSNIYNLMGI